MEQDAAVDKFLAEDHGEVLREVQLATASPSSFG